MQADSICTSFFTTTTCLCNTTNLLQISDSGGIMMTGKCILSICLSALVMAYPCIHYLQPWISTSRPEGVTNCQPESHHQHRQQLQVDTQHPYLDRRCYHYHPNLTAQNLCCPIKNFSSSDLRPLHTCIRMAKVHLANAAGR